MSTPLFEQYKLWQKEKDPNANLKWKEIDEKHFLIHFEFGAKIIPIGYPADKDGIFFMDTGAVSWAQRFNEYVLSKDNAQLNDVLTFMLDSLNKEKKGVLTKSMEDTQVCAQHTQTYAHAGACRILTWTKRAHLMKMLTSTVMTRKLCSQTT